MALANIVQEYLEKSKLPYWAISHPPNKTLQQIAEHMQISTRCLVRVILLRDSHGQLTMAILPSSHILDFTLLCGIVGRDLDPLYGDELSRHFKDCQPGSHPPLPEIFNLTSLVDNSLLDTEQVYFDGGDNDTLVCMDSTDFRTLLKNSRWENFAHSLDTLDELQKQATTLEHINDVTQRYTPTRLREGIEAIKDLPTLPSTALQLLKLRSEPAPNVQELIEIVEYDPSLAAQIIRWARSPHYGGQGNVDSVRDAIPRVLDFDTVMHLVVGSSIGRAFRIPLDGPLGLNAFWRHSVYCATLVSELVKELPPGICPRPGLAYMGGLLHNFGYLLLGYVFPARFFLLNRFVAVNTHLSLDQVEYYVLGTKHTHIGAWLMQAWKMPEELTATVRWHDREDCSQPYAEYPNLVLIANRLLYRLDIGHEPTGKLPNNILSSLQLTQEQALAALTRLNLSRNHLEALSESLSN